MRQALFLQLLLSATVLGACVPRQQAAAPARTQVRELRQLCAELDAPPPLPPPQIAPVVSLPAASLSCPSCDPPRAPELPEPAGTIAPSSQPRAIRVHFSGPDEPYRDCLAHPWVARTVPAGASPVDFAVNAVIRGPTPFEEQQGLYSPYERSTSDPSVRALSPSQVKVRVKDGVAVVDFAQEAAPYLQQAICAQSAVTSAIVFTLLQFKEIRSVSFTIAGAVIEDGDA
jgi:hypothetical protein